MIIKRFTALFLALIMMCSLLTLTGCKDGGEGESSAVSEETADEEFTPTAEALTITIPACAVELIEDNLYNLAPSFGITDIRDGEKGSLVCYISYATKADVQMAAKKNLRDTAEYLMNGTDFITGGDIGRDCDSFVFFCDAATYTEPADVYLLSYYIPALTYHALSTPDQDFLFNKRMTFTFVDNNSFEELGKFEFNGIIEEKKEEEKE